MTTSLTLGLLRPWLPPATPLKMPLCVSCYNAALQQISGKSHHLPGPSGGRKSRRSYSDISIQVGEKRLELHEGNTSHSKVKASRIQKLRDHDLLRYPRLQNIEIQPVDLRSCELQHSSELAPGESAAQTVSVSGRVMAVRRQGSKLMFLDLQQDYYRVQVMVHYKNLDIAEKEDTDFLNASKTLLRGDHVRVVGSPHRTPAGQFSIKATKVPELLAPSLDLIPTSLVKEDTMSHSRHLDILVNQRASEVLRARSAILWSMRSFFVNSGFTEVQTPILAGHAGGAVARPFLTSATEFGGTVLALRIAPELWLKRLVVGGLDRIFEIGAAFRNEGLDGAHNPEFTICEFYAAYINLDTLMDMTKRLVEQVATSYEQFVRAAASPVGQCPSTPLEFPHQEYIDSGNFSVIEFVPALEKMLGFQFPNLAQPEAKDQLEALLTNTKPDYVIEQGASLNKVLDNLASAFLEPLSLKKPLFITHHPACMSPLAKSFRDQKTGQVVSARAEIFMMGQEIANMYEEENDPFEQRRKFELQAQAARNRPEPASTQLSSSSSLDAQTTNKNDGDEDSSCVDESYIQALECGLPPTGGWGCGVDRLVMFFTGATRIADTLTFGNLRNVISTTRYPEKRRLESAEKEQEEHK